MSLRNALALTMAVALTGSSFAQAAASPSPWDADRSVPVCTEAHDQERPAVSSAKQGLIVVWQDSRPQGGRSRHTGGSRRNRMDRRL